jgi:DNA-binding response OmpR family regulator
VVDDDAALRRVLRLSFGAFGFVVTEASTGAQALAALDNAQYDVVLLDIDMPGMDGVEICRQIHQVELRPAVIMYTGRDSAEDRAAALEAGAADYVLKPAPLGDLVARLRIALRDRHLRTA